VFLWRSGFGSEMLLRLAMVSNLVTAVLYIRYISNHWPCLAFCFNRETSGNSPMDLMPPRCYLLVYAYLYDRISIILQILKKHHYFFFVKCALSRLLKQHRWFKSDRSVSILLYLQQPFQRVYMSRSALAHQKAFSMETACSEIYVVAPISDAALDLALL